MFHVSPRGGKTSRRGRGGAAAAATSRLGLKSRLGIQVKWTQGLRWDHHDLAGGSPRILHRNRVVENQRPQQPHGLPDGKFGPARLCDRRTPNRVSVTAGKGGGIKDLECCSLWWENVSV